jgi:putative hydrolase of the HAD superfamily
MKNMHVIKAIIFDLDNTLTHRAQSINAFSRHFLKVYGHLLTGITLTELQRRLNAIDNGGYGRKENPYPSIKKSITHYLHTELKWANTPSEDVLFNTWVTGFPECSVEMPGAVELIKTLKTKGYQVAVLSNGMHSSRINTLEHLGLLPVLDYACSSDQLGIKKPEPEAFKAVTRKLKRAPEECLFVGDHPTVDIEGVLNVGMQAVWFSGFHEWPKDQPKPTREISVLNELLTHLV